VADDAKISTSRGHAAASERGVTIKLTDRQVSQVVREASGGTGLARMMSTVDDLDDLRGMVQPLLDDPKCSRSTFRALMVLVAFPPDGRELELTDVADELGLSPSTTHRYVSTWLAVGLLEQDPRSRRYRRARIRGARGSRALAASIAGATAGND
jgi:DNA-binding MarR family transcriptional regulator